MNAATQLAIPDTAPVDSSVTLTAVASRRAAPGTVKVERHTHKYLLGETLLEIGRVEVQPKGTQRLEDKIEVTPQFPVYAIYEIPAGVNMLKGEVMDESLFTRGRYYSSAQVAKWAFVELQQNNGTIQTLSPSFSGRDVMEMKAHLKQNFVYKG